MCVCVCVGVSVGAEKMGIRRAVLDSASVTFKMVSGVYGVLVAI